MKICNCCKQKKSETDFSFRSEGKGYLRSECKECSAKRFRLWRSLNLEKAKAASLKSVREYVKNNPIKAKKKQLECYLRRRKSDPTFRALCNLRTRIRDALRRNVKSASTKELLGCSIEKFKSHLENQFQPGMTWENYGQWHVDHIKPCAKFDLTIPEQQRQCFHYSNCQPLWAKQNLQKSDFYFNP